MRESRRKRQSHPVWTVFPTTIKVSEFQERVLVPSRPQHEVNITLTNSIKYVIDLYLMRLVRHSKHKENKDSHKYFGGADRNVREWIHYFLGFAMTVSNTCLGSIGEHCYNVRNVIAILIMGWNVKGQTTGRSGNVRTLLQYCVMLKYDELLDDGN